MTFLEQYGEELSLQLSSDQASTGLFTTARRKAQVNAGCREFVRLTKCVTRRGTLTLVDGTGEYDLEAAFTDYWWLSEQEGITLKLIDGSANSTYYVQDKALTRVDVRRLDREHPGWRSADPGTPRYFYLRQEGGQTLLGFYPPPSIEAGGSGFALVPYVPHLVDMTADIDEPFTVDSNAPKRLRPWHMAPVHYAAYKLETARKQYGAAKEQLQLFAGLVQDYFDKQGIPGGDVVSFAHDYMAGVRNRGGFSGDPLVDF